MKIVDLASVAKVAKQKKILTLIDNTFATPYWQKPLDLGIDMSLHSASKYLGGHSDVTGGCIMLNDKELAGRIGFLQNAVGAVLSPFDSYNLLKGIKTLELRMKKHEENTIRVVDFLSTHKKVKNIYYPGLATHPQYKLAQKQMKGYGSVLTIELHGTVATAKKFLESLKLFAIALNLGEVASLIEHPATMTHAAMPKEEREKCGITDTLIRLAIGIEDADDLIADLSQGLDKI
jgi:cystathionine gamma-lyase